MDPLDGAHLQSLEGMDLEAATQASLNISDVIEVIQTTDPEFAGTDIFSGNSEMEDSRKRSAYVKILEQPASKALRFRYECEGRSAGSIPGSNSTPENKTFPTIQIVGYQGRAVVVVSCVTKDSPYRPHPHNLVGKEGCKKGICTMEINSDNMTVTFSNLGIQCVKKKDIDEALRTREEIRVDPFKTGFSHRNQPTSIDLNAVRLCFQVFLEGNEKGKFTFHLPPVVSYPIFDKKAMSDLVICKLSECSCSVAGGKEIILLCEKVAKEDIQIRFYEEKDNQIVWEGFGEFQPSHVHKQVAISFRTPRYKTLEVESSVRVNIQLRRLSDGATSEPRAFELYPLDSDPDLIKRKRQKLSGESNPQSLKHSKESTDKSRVLLHQNIYTLGGQTTDLSTRLLHNVKHEPKDPSASNYLFMAGNQSPMYAAGLTSPSPSPQSIGRTPSPMEIHSSPYQSHDEYSMKQSFPYGLLEIIPNDSNLPVIANTFPQLISMSSQIIPNNASTQDLGLMHNVDTRMNHLQSRPESILSSNSLNNNANINQAILTIPETSILDLDSQGYNIPQIDSDFNVQLFGENLSENLSNHLTLSDSKTKETDQPSMNMNTDSLTNLTKVTIQELCATNSIFKGTEQH